MVGEKMPKKLSQTAQEDFLKIFGNKDHYYNIRRACKEAKIGKSTLYRWLQDPRFEKEIKKIKAKRNKDPIKAMKEGHIIKYFKMLGVNIKMPRWRC